MGRWEAGADQRLAAAALELFAEQGFAETTVPQITARAGLTTRTFFRHFADKREVLYGFVSGLPEFVETVMTSAPESLDVLGVIGWGLEEIAALRLAGQHGNLRQHREIVRSDDSLLEREAHKNAVLAEASRLAFLARGLDPVDASLAAQLGMAIFLASLDRWLDVESETDLPAIIRDTVARARALAS